MLYFEWIISIQILCFNKTHYFAGRFHLILYIIKFSQNSYVPTMINFPSIFIETTWARAGTNAHYDPTYITIMHMLVRYKQT